MNLIFAFEKPSLITRCSIRVMLIEHADRLGILWFAQKNNRPSRSLWRHYPVRLESIFSCCGNDCAAALTGVPSLFAGQYTSNATTRPRLSLRHLSLIRLTTYSYIYMYNLDIRSMFLHVCTYDSCLKTLINNFPEIRFV